MRLYKIFLIIYITFMPLVSNAQVYINEIMYDLKTGSDAGREWVEVFNNSESEVDLTGWKFNDGSNHNLNIPPANGGIGSIKIPAGGYAILASDAVAFILEHSGFSSTLIDTVMSLGQQPDNTYTLSLISKTGGMIDTVNYTTTQGANGDDNSLQKISDGWISALPTPGITNSGSTPTDTTTDDTDTSDQTEDSNDSNNSPSSTGAHSSTASLSTVSEEMGFQIFAGRDRLTTVGNNLKFQAVVTKIQGAPESAITYVWSFGDGTIGQGTNPNHSYRFAGDYDVILNGYYSDKQAVSRTKIKVVVPRVSLVRVLGGVEITNNSGVEINLGEWKLAGPHKVFTFPDDTLISNNKKVIFADEVTGISDEDIELLNPVGKSIDIVKDENISTTFTLVSITPPFNADEIQAKIDDAKNQLALLSAQLQLTSQNNIAVVTPEVSSQSVSLGENKSPMSDIGVNNTATVFEATKQTGIVSTLFSWPIRGFNFIRHLFMED